MKKQLLIWLFAIGLCHFANGQQKSLWQQPIPIKVSILDQSTSLPNFWFTRYSYNPAITVGTELILKKKKNHDWHLTGNLGFYHHKNWQNAAFLNSEIGFRQHFGRLSANARFGLGYSHTFAAAPVFTQESGEWKEKTDFGNPTLNTSLGIGLEYILGQSETSPTLTMTYQSMVDIPFNIYTSLHHFVGLGFKFYPFQNNI